METQVRTPQSVFMMPQVLAVPLFQRPYVWNRDSQWEPLWQDVVRVADRVLNGPSLPPPHFLGAVVLQKLPNPIGSLPAWSIIDGQQRLTTLQLLLDALHAELVAVDADAPAQRVETLVANPAAFGSGPRDQFKVWPTNRDRPAFDAVMGADPPIAYDALEHREERLTQAHRYFADEARAWLGLNGPEDVASRANAIDRVVRELLQMVVIDLQADENAQEIFETLNARGTPLTAADLIKNFVFQRLAEQGVDVEATYNRRWKDFETGFWEAEMVFGRLRYSRSSIYMNHWLIARTGEEIVAREVFSRFKRYADEEASVPMLDLVEQIHRASDPYRRFVEGATASNPINRLQLFAYRTSVLESEVFKPVILWLYDPEQPAIADDQLRRSLDVLESWLVRRGLVRAPSSSYTQVAAELVTQLKKSDRSRSGDAIETYFAGQTVDSRYWPDDREVRDQLTELRIYQRIRRRRLRMVLEAIEDHLRGWTGISEGLGGERVPRGKFHIEHVMPRRWHTHWPLEAGGLGDADRDHLVQTLGNLTLLTGRLNTRVSHGPWATKRQSIAEHDVLKLNTDLVHEAGDLWTEDRIRDRAQRLIDLILEIWPVPEGHVSSNATSASRVRQRVGLADLIGAGLLDAGTVLYARRRALSGRTATVLADGRLDVDGTVFATPSGAAKSILGRTVNGWRFFVVDQARRRRLADVLQDYVDQTAADIEEVIDDDDDDDPEEPSSPS